MSPNQSLGNPLEAAVAILVKRAAVVRLVKRASSKSADWSSVLAGAGNWAKANKPLAGALAGAGGGALLGGALGMTKNEDGKRSPWSGALSGALAGGGLGMGAGLAADMWKGIKTDTPTQSIVDQYTAAKAKSTGPAAKALDALKPGVANRYFGTPMAVWGGSEGFNKLRDIAGSRYGKIRDPRFFSDALGHHLSTAKDLPKDAVTSLRELMGKPENVRVGFIDALRNHKAQDAGRGVQAAEAAERAAGVSAWQRLYQPRTPGPAPAASPVTPLPAAEAVTEAARRGGYHGVTADSLEKIYGDYAKAMKAEGNVVRSGLSNPRALVPGAAVNRVNVAKPSLGFKGRAGVATSLGLLLTTLFNSGDPKARATAAQLAKDHPEIINQLQNQ